MQLLGMEGGREEVRDAAWWKQTRPRPYRGNSADPSIPAEEVRPGLTAGEGGSEAAGNDSDDTRLRNYRGNQEANVFPGKAGRKSPTADVEVSGSAAGDVLVGNDAAKIDRNEREQQACLFAHLYSDAEEEYRQRENEYKSHQANKKKVSEHATGLLAPDVLPRRLIAPPSIEQKRREREQQQQHSRFFHLQDMASAQLAAAGLRRRGEIR
eukprot:750308-Hanusia_phi.AAC.4